MSTEITALVLAGASLTGGGIFVARWVDSVNESLRKLNDGQLETHERLAAVEAKLPNGEIKELVGEVRLLREELLRQK